MTDRFELVPFFRALSDPTRLRVLNLLAGGEVCVCFFVAVIGTNQPKISRHLAYLRKAGVVSSRRHGKWIYYRIAEPPSAGLAVLLRGVVARLAQDPQMQNDRERLRGMQVASDEGPIAGAPATDLATVSPRRNVKRRPAAAPGAGQILGSHADRRERPQIRSNR